MREQPSAYEVGRGEQGVFNCEPYSSELLPLWSVTSLEEAEAGAEAIHRQFREYRDASLVTRAKWTLFGRDGGDED